MTAWIDVRLDNSDHQQWINLLFRIMLLFFNNGIINAVINSFNDLSTRDDVSNLWDNYIFLEHLKKQSYYNRLFQTIIFSISTIIKRQTWLKKERVSYSDLSSNGVIRRQNHLNYGLQLKKKRNTKSFPGKIIQSLLHNSCTYLFRGCYKSLESIIK